MARDAITFIDALGLAETDLLAHSMGGLGAQETALARPAFARKLVLVGRATVINEAAVGKTRWTTFADPDGNEFDLIAG